MDCSVDMQFCEFIVQRECVLWMLQLLMLLNSKIVIKDLGVC